MTDPSRTNVLRRVPASVAHLVLLFGCASLLAWPRHLDAQLFTNLQSLVHRLPAGDPSVNPTESLDGPKGICRGDFDGDLEADMAIANTDGTVTLYYGLGAARFREPVHLQTGFEELRGIVCGDVTGDGRPDIVAASPYAGKVFVFINQNGAFGAPVVLEAWSGARNLGVGDFDGDGTNDLVVAGPGMGVRHLRSLGDGAFETLTNLTFLALNAEHEEFPKPVFSLASFRPTGGTRDRLVVTHAVSDRVWTLAQADAEGPLEVVGQIETKRIHSLKVGPIVGTAASGQVDLVLVSRDRGSILIHQGNATAAGFDEEPDQIIEVPGGPREVEIVDMNGDGWNDLVVVLRNFDRVVTYQNSNGVLVASREMPVGASPRDLVSADFDRDGNPDVAVMNRDSMDVSILLAYPGAVGFGALDTVYPVDGEVSGLVVFDFDKDGRDDVVQLHRASAEFSVRRALEGGLLAEPAFYPLDASPGAQAAADVNNDGIVDMVTANLGREGNGSVSVRLGDGAGGFGEEERFYLPPEAHGGLFALVAADFDKDGNIDLAAGFFDCRLAFFRGRGDGTFEHTRTHRFVYESRVMVTGDFDRDGDTDLAGAGYAGDVVVVENRGDLLTADSLTRTDYPSPSEGKFGTRDILATDLNGDDDLDLLVGSGDGTMMFIGGPGMSFTLVSASLPGTSFPSAAVALGDFDDDGVQDIAVSCRILSCVSILVSDGMGSYAPSVTVDVPSGGFLAGGDLDGDGKSDLVGSGGVLWTALSSRVGALSPPPVVQASRQTIQRPVINELLAINTEWPLAIDGDRASDWVEVFNGSPTAISLSGWKLCLSGDGVEGTNEFSFPPTAFFPSGRHLTVVFANEVRSVYHTGFRLPGNGGTLRLLNPAGEEVDCVVYSKQLENVAYGRYLDGLPALVANPYPSPGRANTDNGPVEPAVEMEEIHRDFLTAGVPLRFAVRAEDDIGVIGMSLLYKRMDVPGAEVVRLPLFDDGEHDDGGMLDGLFAGTLAAGLPAGAEIQFYIEAVDLSGKVVIKPDEPVFARGSGGGGMAAVTLYSLAIDSPDSPIEISEVLTSNVTGLMDETGSHPDWVEIRNCSDEPVPMFGLQLARRFFGTGSRYEFGPADVLAPGEHRVILCDNQPDQGSLHAPFDLSREGDRVVLTGFTTNGVRTLIDEVEFGVQLEDVSLARLGCDGEFRQDRPTPAGGNVPGSWVGVVERNELAFTLAFPTRSNAVYTVEHTLDPVNPQWVAEPAVIGDGIEKRITQPLVRQRYYRIREDSVP